MKANTILTDRQTELVYHYSKERLSNSTQYYGIDVLKFICSILVFLIHIPMVSDLRFLPYQLFVRCITRVAVPFYFTSAGFFLYNKIDLNNLDSRRVKSYCFKILRLLGTWTVLLIVGGQLQLWYMGSLVTAVLLVYYLVHRSCSFKVMVALSLFLYGIGLLGDAYYGIIEVFKSNNTIYWVDYIYTELFTNTRNGVFMGFTFVLIGVFFSLKKVKIKMWIAVIAFCASMCLVVAEAYVLYSFKIAEKYNMYIFLLPAIFFLFYISANIRLKPRMIYKRLRIVGMLVFYMHLLVYYLINTFGIKIMERIIGIQITQPFIIFSITLGVTIGVAILIERLSLTNRFRVLRYLYS